MDWLKYDQYLGILLTGWSVEAVVEVIERNNQRRLRQKAKKTVQFTLPSAEKTVGSDSKEEENWSVVQWLEQIGMAKYQDNFMSAGYISLQDIQVCFYFLFSFLLGNFVCVIFFCEFCSLTVHFEGVVKCRFGENGHQCATSSQDHPTGV